MIQDADVNRLKCIMFYYVKTLMEIDWYGLKCNRTDFFNNAKKANLYLKMIETGCTLPYELECLIKTFIKTKASNCITVLTPCNRLTSNIDSGGGNA